MTQIGVTGGGKQDAYFAGVLARFGGNPELKVGFLENSQGGKNADVHGPSLAFWLEFGTKYMPARPFFRGMIADKSPTWGNLMASSMKATGNDPRKALRQVGEVVRAQLQLSMDRFTTPALKQATKDRKGFDQPLEESKNLRNSIDFEVADGS